MATRQKDTRSITTPGGALHVLNDSDALLKKTASARLNAFTETTANVDGGKGAMQFGAGDDSREGETSAGKNPVCWSSEEITGWSWLFSIRIRR